MAGTGKPLMPWEREWDPPLVEIERICGLFTTLGWPVTHADLAARLGYPVAEASDAEQRAVVAALFAVWDAIQRRLTEPGG